MNERRSEAYVEKVKNEEITSLRSYKKKTETPVKWNINKKILEVRLVELFFGFIEVKRKTEIFIKIILQSRSLSLFCY